MVPLAGIEPALLAESDFESDASTSSAIGARWEGLYPAKIQNSSPIARVGHGKRVGSLILVVAVLSALIGCMGDSPIQPFSDQGLQTQFLINLSV